ncbi:hypothetical protein B296_00005587 [Ensete ventricosum]|uniref:Uncharacterized protein n=1 Tax=Ensete ventricosum TaxID=4639 RepID=A0A426Y4B5_ENSVE|nr:hypothetical protein B296_00005587 [Ensete ventricosum]
MVSRADQMSSTSSRFESCSVKILAHRSRALSHPSGDSRLTSIISPSGGRAPGDSGTADALTTIRQRAHHNRCRCAQAKKHPSTREGASLRKYARRMAFEQPADASGSTARAPAEKGMRVVELEKAPEWGYTIQELCKVEVLRSSLDGARNDRVRLEGEVLSLNEVAAFLENDLKGEGPKAVATYKASRGFELGLEKMGKVSYEFEYRVAVEQLRGKHLKIVIEKDPFAECLDDANMKMDLNQPFDDSTLSEK